MPIDTFGKTYPDPGGVVFRRAVLPRRSLWRGNLLPPVQIAAAAEQNQDHHDDQKDR